MLNIVPFGTAVLETNIFKHFPIYHYTNILTLETSFEQASVSWS